MLVVLYGQALRTFTTRTCYENSTVNIAPPDCERIVKLRRADCLLDRREFSYLLKPFYESLVHHFNFMVRLLSLVVLKRAADGQT
jgi:hypothetical protein